MSANHFIKELTVEIDLGPYTNSADIHNKAGLFCNERLSKSLNQLFNEFTSDKEVIDLGKVEIDCGNLKSDNFEEKLEIIVIDHFKKILQIQKDKKQKSPATAYWEELFFFLDNGSLPWNARYSNAKKLFAEFKLQSNLNPVEKETFIDKVLTDSLSRSRILNLLTAEQIIELWAELLKTSQNSIRSLVLQARSIDLSHDSKKIFSDKEVLNKMILSLSPMHPLTETDKSTFLKNYWIEKWSAQFNNKWLVEKLIQNKLSSEDVFCLKIIINILGESLLSLLKQNLEKQSFLQENCSQQLNKKIISNLHKNFKLISNLILDHFPNSVFEDTEQVEETDSSTLNSEEETEFDHQNTQKETPSKKLTEKGTKTTDENEKALKKKDESDYFEQQSFEEELLDEKATNIADENEQTLNTEDESEFFEQRSVEEKNKADKETEHQKFKNKKEDVSDSSENNISSSKKDALNSEDESEQLAFDEVESHSPAPLKSSQSKKFKKVKNNPIDPSKKKPDLGDEELTDEKKKTEKNEAELVDEKEQTRNEQNGLNSKVEPLKNPAEQSISKSTDPKHFDKQEQEISQERPAKKKEKAIKQKASVKTPKESSRESSIEETGNEASKSNIKAKKDKELSNSDELKPENKHEGEIQKIEDCTSNEEQQNSLTLDPNNDVPSKTQNVENQHSRSNTEQDLKSQQLHQAVQNSLQTGEENFENKLSSASHSTESETIQAINNKTVNLEDSIKQRFASFHKSLKSGTLPVKKKVKKLKRRNTDEYYINNSGLVIMNPFLSSFYEQAGLLVDGKLSDENKAMAIHLSHYLVYGEEVECETQLALNKILCGLMPWQPINMDVELNQKLKDACDPLLNAVLQYWTPLNNSSHESLRNTFFLREGIIKSSNSIWTLRVQRQQLDILMEKIPWSFSMIKFSWMNQALEVTW